MSDTATQLEAAASSPEAAASAAIQKASESSAAQVAANPKVNIDLINPEAKAAIEAIKALQAGGAKKFNGKTAEECIDEGVVVALKSTSEAEKNNILSGTTKDVVTSGVSSIASSLFGGIAGKAVSAGSNALGTKAVIDMVKKAQAEVDACMGEAIATGSIQPDVFAKRKEITTMDVGVDAAKSTASASVQSIPFVGGMFGGGKKKETAPAPDADPTRVTMDMISAIAKKKDGAAR